MRATAIEVLSSCIGRFLSGACYVAGAVVALKLMGLL